MELAARRARWSRRKARKDGRSQGPRRYAFDYRRESEEIRRAGRRAAAAADVADFVNDDPAARTAADEARALMAYLTRFEADGACPCCW
jgi:hypothetical protein